MGKKERKQQDVAPPRLRPWLGEIMVLVVAIAAFAQTLAGDFVFDDVAIVRENAILRDISNIPKLFQLNYWGEAERYLDKSLYRPVTMATYALNYFLLGPAPWGFHLINILLNALCAWLLYRLVLELSASWRLSLATALLFAVHPIHTEVVAGIVGRAELLAFLGTFICLWAYLRGTGDDTISPVRRYAWLLASVAGYGLGLFSKEGGMLAPAFIILTEILLPERRRLLKLQGRAIAAVVGYTAALTGYLVLRSKAVLTSVQSPEFGDLTPYQRILTAIRTCMEYVGLLLYPGTLSADYPRADLHVANNPAEPGVFLAVALLGLAFFLVVWFWKRQPLISWGLLFFMMALFPVSNLPFPIYVMKAERLLFTPSAGFLLALVALIHYGLEQKRSDTLFWPVIGIVAAVFLMRTTVRNEDWRNNFTLASATLKTSPTSQRMKTLIFNWYRDHGQNDLARQYLAAAYGDASRNDSGAMYNLANLELDSKNYAEAIRLYRRILEAEPNNANAMNNLGQALDEAGRLEEAVKVYERLLQLQPDSPGPYVNLMHVLLRLKAPQRALQIAEAAMPKFPRNEGVWWNAGAVYQELGRTEEAQAAFKRAQQIDANITQKQTLRLEY